MLVHVGADLFVREIYSDHPPYHDLFVLDAKGNPRVPEQADLAGSEKMVVMGPLCFAGDQFPGLHDLAPEGPGDWLAIADCGANTTALWSRHCSRTPPDWVSFRSDKNDYAFARQAAVFAPMY
jgi:diaminopimelate decarboxylase